MKTHCEQPYQAMISTASAVRRLSEDTSTWHVRRLATDLAGAVCDLDGRMRAVLELPRAWQSTPDADKTTDGGSAEEADDTAPVDTDGHEPGFYTLPAADLEEGMSTADGQDIVSVGTDPDGTVFADVYTPRSDDPELDERNRSETECRMYQPGERVAMGTFVDTEIDGSSAANALPLHATDRRA
ncbi:hypothetical protein HFP15_31110 [Amycolatopsis sp. K13G38]|uniref:Uncharacterized protein n=1 Tax=Amycolatopsis acididurans TaxID=2724524 RepID=A0ABX1JFY0_9PSEU|nr:hypothetical protein [Amycolatopsis acididurans]NKQ57325.1 hypothetical protein [Amycolatopsis acididurans]